MCSVCISLCSFNVRKWIAVDVTVRHFCFGRYRENTDSQGVKTAGEYRLPRFLSGCGATLAILLSLDPPVVLRFLAGIVPVLIGRQSEWLALPIRVDVQARFSPYPWLASRHRVVLKIPTLNVLEHKGGGLRICTEMARSLFSCLLVRRGNPCPLGNKISAIDVLSATLS